MPYLLLGILFNVAIFLVFRAYVRFGVNTLPAIVVNYYVCVLTGTIFMNDISAFGLLSFDSPWLIIGLLLGIVFLGTFYMMAVTTQRLSVTVSSIAAKMSLALPVLFSLFVLQIDSKDFNLLNYLGIALAFVAIYLSSIKRRDKAPKTEVIKQNRLLLLLPVGVFLCSGIIDTTINFTAYRYLSVREEALFPLVIFSSAGVLGTLMLLVRRAKIGVKEFWGGVLLGAPNYFSIYFIVKGLAEFDNNGAFFYPILNISIILGSSLAAIVFFREKLLTLNKIGLALAVLAIFLISYQEILQIK